MSIENNFRRPSIVRTSELKFPNPYALALDGEYSEYALSEDRAPQWRGKWRSEVFKVQDQVPMDLEIGTGNGYFFRHRAITHSERCLVGVEIKYKPLIQSIRRTLKAGAKNARMVRFHAFNLDLLFEVGELDDVFVQFPDPWVSPSKPKNRVFNERLLNVIYDLQKTGSEIEFKTDSMIYFDWVLELLPRTKYVTVALSRNLHNSEWAEKNFITSFESIFLKQKLPIYYLKLKKCG